MENLPNGELTAGMVRVQFLAEEVRNRQRQVAELPESVTAFSSEKRNVEFNAKYYKCETYGHKKIDCHAKDMKHNLKEAKCTGVGFTNLLEIRFINVVKKMLNALRLDKKQNSLDPVIHEENELEHETELRMALLFKTFLYGNM
uniref:Uncharacterized protein n=1 Tax=Glossina austeni TaxID=7395 RepID=A0A1A9UDH8_GLOAU